MHVNVVFKIGRTFLAVATPVEKHIIFLQENINIIKPNNDSDSTNYKTIFNLKQNTDILIKTFQEILI